MILLSLGIFKIKNKIGIVANVFFYLLLISGLLSITYLLDFISKIFTIPLIITQIVIYSKLHKMYNIEK